ncbi:MAG TPA: flavodoxin family protein [Candidatus Hydrogenedentes bacterium]|nr:flavodoxin family protein [Candidatus Hydrogenedentota bacterium]HRT18863.1 flavodoxin family protein [Candidatus Hydrogenedentota bacterium]HRT65588.1 flavodoxin family protein [Candidatus Hydrogenedentota bacterium]
MSSKIGRRELIGAAGAAIVAGAIGGEAAAQDALPKRKIIGISCSPRKGKTTAAAVALCLKAAEEQDPGLATELIELADFSIPAQLAAGQPLREGEADDFPKLVEKLGDPAVAGIIVGSPVYFGNMSALCKAFLDRCFAFRKDGFKLRNKVVGVLAVGSTRNGGQELTIRSIQTALMCQDMVVVGDGQPSARVGATLWNQNDSIEGDDFGKDTAKNLGRRVAELTALIGA